MVQWKVRIHIGNTAQRVKESVCLVVLRCVSLDSWNCLSCVFAGVWNRGEMWGCFCVLVRASMGIVSTWKEWASWRSGDEKDDFGMDFAYMALVGYFDEVLDAAV